MKTEDFERLRAICEKEGFGIFRNGENVIVANKKDHWGGVEFAEFIHDSSSAFTRGKIYRVNPDGKGVDFSDIIIDNFNSENGFYPNNRMYFKPSTKEAYLNGEIK